MIQQPNPQGASETWLAAMGFIGLVAACFVVSYQCNRVPDPLPVSPDSVALPVDATPTDLPAAVSPADIASPVTP